MNGIFNTHDLHTISLILNAAYELRNVNSTCEDGTCILIRKFMVELNKVDRHA